MRFHLCYYDVIFKQSWFSKQAANKITGSNYTKSKLVYVYVFVYTSKRDPSIGFLIYNPGEEN